MPFGAIYAAAVTPHREVAYETDLGSTLDLVDYLCAAQVHGIALLGSTGEFLQPAFQPLHLILIAALNRAVQAKHELGNRAGHARNSSIGASGARARKNHVVARQKREGCGIPQRFEFQKLIEIST